MNPYTARFRAARLAFCGSLLCAAFALAALGKDQTNEEHQLIATLQSAASPHDKDGACARLKRIGTTDCIPALSALLADEQLSHSARYALESLPGPEATHALIAALNRTSGPAKVGLINSIGVRADKAGLSPLTKLLNDKDRDVAVAAAHALGHIADSSALTALMRTSREGTGEFHQACAEAGLQCADELTRISPRQANAAFETIYHHATSQRLRVAAYRGMIRTAGKNSGRLLIQAITGDTGPAQIAALQIVHEPETAALAKEIASLLLKVNPTVQAAVIEGLTQSGDLSIVSAARDLIASPDDGVRLAVIKCFGSLGDESVILPLAKSATTGSGSEQAAARDALAQLHRGNITQRLLAQLKAAEPAIQAELARALGRRGDAGAVPALLQLARSESDSVRAPALQSVGFLAQPSQIGAIVQVIIQAKTDDARAEAADALNSALQRLSGRGNVDVTVVAQALSQAPSEARIALLGVVSGLKDTQIRAALRAGIHDPDSKVREAAIRALCDTADGDLLPDVLNLARSQTDEKFRTLAIAAVVRLTTQEETLKLADADRIEALKSILAASPNLAQKRLILSGLAAIPTEASLKAAEPMLDEPDTQPEAIRTVLKIAISLPQGRNEATRAALERIEPLASDPDTRKTIVDALKKTKTGRGLGGPESRQ